LILFKLILLVAVGVIELRAVDYYHSSERCSFL